MQKHHPSCVYQPEQLFPRCCRRILSQPPYSVDESVDRLTQGFIHVREPDAVLVDIVHHCFVDGPHDLGLCLDVRVVREEEGAANLISLEKDFFRIEEHPRDAQVFGKTEKSSRAMLAFEVYADWRAEILALRYMKKLVGFFQEQ